MKVFVFKTLPILYSKETAFEVLKRHPSSTNYIFTWYPFLQMKLLSAHIN